MSTTSTRNPYIVGGWVTGNRFYGHVSLRHHLLHGPNNYLWLVGTRRVGKTSLLRQLDVEAGPDYIPIYWDMQGCQTGKDLDEEFFYAIEEKSARFKALGIDVEGLEGTDVRELLRTIARETTKHHLRILLLVDEPEVLIPLAHQEEGLTRRLRAALQRPPNLRVILASTKSFTRIDQVGDGWETSPFLYGFTTRYLAGLSPTESAALIRQTQSSQPVRVSEDIVRHIQWHTNHHPYLVQWLCSHLYQDDHTLRMPGEDDILLDNMLNALFALSYKHLSPAERHILLYLLEVNSTDPEDLAQALDVSEDESSMYLYAMTSIGYTRRLDVGRQVAIGNSFLRRWLLNNADVLAKSDAEVADHTVQEIAAAGHEQEATLWQQQLQSYRINLARLEAEAAKYGAFPPLHIQNEIDAHKDKIRELEHRLDDLGADLSVSLES